MRALAARAGRGLGPGGDEADHLAVGLALLAALSEPDGGERGRQAARELLDRQLLWWLPPFVVAVEEEGDRFWTLAAELTLELTVDHRRGLGGRVAAACPLPPPEPPPTELPDAAALARLLASPARSGLHLSAGVLRRLGRRLELPGGFGPRARLLENLLGAGAAYGALLPLLSALRARAAAAAARHRAFSRQWPELEPVSRAWVERLEGTGALLRALERTLEEGSGGS